MTPGPSVGVVIPTRDRVELVRRAVCSILAQDFDGSLRVVIVHDGSPVDETIVDIDPSRICVVDNQREPGLPGARNTGILALECDLIAFCDDDDEWLPGKLSAQIAALGAHPDAEVATCGILVSFEGKESLRTVPSHLVNREALLRSRMAMLHSSTFLIRRDALLDGLDLVAEDAPGGQNEDWDLLLRAAARHPIVNVPEPGVRVLWGRSSHFARRWQTKIDSLEWMLARHPDLRENPVGFARVEGQLAFAHACLGDRAAARRKAMTALRSHWREWRALVALAVAYRLVSGERVLGGLHRFGRGV